MRPNSFGRFFTTIVGGLIAATVVVLAGPCNAAELAGALRLRLALPGLLSVHGQVLDRAQLRTFYAARGYDLAWDGGGPGLGPDALAAVSAILNADGEGLEPADYHLKDIDELAAAQFEMDRVDRDLLITDGLLRFAADLSIGRVAPQGSDERTISADAAWIAPTLAQASRDPNRLVRLIATLPPADPLYGALRAKLAEFRAAAASGGWDALPDGQTLHPGERDPAVPALRKRLAVGGWLAPQAQRSQKGSEDLFDPKTSAALAAFQAVHGIKPDGVLGKDTRMALDASVDARIRQVVANMERLRWSDGVPAQGRAVQVNLAAYALVVYQDGDPILNMPVVVGSSENPTPIISSRITTVVLNPNWTLPPNVIKELLPRIRADDRYLAGRGIARVLDDGKVRLVQPPGPGNPLGRFKFVMPNNQDIYLHDSPDVVKFRYARRAYSHGCVRLSNAAALASLLLDDRVQTIPNGLDAAVQSGNTRHIPLSKPVPVNFVYHTAWLDDSGRLVLGIDTYDRDSRLWRSMHKARGAPTRRMASGASPGQVL